MEYTMGIDVSKWQDDNSTPQMMDFNKSKAGGVEFVGIKISQSNYLDPDMIMNWANAKATGLPRLGYHYLDWDKNAYVQAETFLGAVKKDPPEMMLVVDYEKRTGAPSAGTARLLLKNTLEHLKRNTKCKLGIYTSPSFWAEYGSADPYWEQYTLWLAHYTKETLVRVPAPWKKWTIWQWTDKGPGKALGAESHGLDMNWYNGSVEEMRAQFGIAQPEPVLSWEQSIDAWARTQGYNGIKPTE